MQRVRVNYLLRRSIYKLTLLGVLFIAGCIRNSLPIVEENLPAISVEPSHPILAMNNYYYYVDGERVQLKPSFDWVVVMFASSVLTVRENALNSYGSLLGPLNQVRDIPALGITLLPLQTGLTPEAFTELIERMRKDKVIFSEVNLLFHTGDSEMAIGDEFIAVFPPGKSQTEIDEINSIHGVELVRPILGQENTFVLQVTGDAELDTLSIANLYQESGIAVSAAPNFIRIKSNIDS